MRITILTPPDILTGGTRVIAIYAAGLQARGHEVQVVSTGHPAVSLREHLRAIRRGGWRQLRRERLAQRQPGHIARAGVPHRVLERHRPIVAGDLPDADVVVATWWETAEWMHALPPGKGRKVHLVQGYETWWGGAEAAARVQRALRLPNLKVAISAGLKRDIETDLGDLGIQVVNNAVDGVQFDAPPRVRGTPPTIGFIYARDLIKGPDRCFKVIEQVRRRLPGVGVLAFGAQQPGDGLPLPQGTEFHYRPSQELIPRLYARCDAWLFATRVDSFGLPILEAMGCRTPVVGVPVGAAPDLLSDDAGVLVAADSEAALPGALADALVRLLDGPPERWQAVSDRAYRRAHRYTWDDAVARFEALIARPRAVPPLTGESQACRHDTPLPLSLPA